MTATPLYLFAKAPLAGLAKQRLCPPLSAKQAAQVAAALLSHSADIVERGWLGQCVMNVTPDLTHRAFDVYEQGLKWQTRVQLMADLGERMREALEEGIEACGAAVVLGTDIPAINAKLLHEVFRILQTGQAVIGPSKDGGFYLLGMRAMPDELFSGIRWGSAEVYTALLGNARRLGIKFQILPVLSDCDYFKDVRQAAQTVSSI